MRILIPALLATFLLTACGNPDYGKEFKPNGAKTSASTTAASIAAPAQNPALTYGPCKALTVFGGSNSALAQDFAGSSACAGISVPSMVRLKVSANFPAHARVCLVPLNPGATHTASCFTVNGQIDVALSTKDYQSVTLLYESHLSSYASYMSGQTNLYPPLAHATLR